MGNQKGLAMPLVLAVIFILSLLGTALWQYSTTDLKQVTMDDQRKQAYYLARSGADAVAEFIVKNPLNWTDQAMTDYLNTLSNAPHSQPTNLGSGSFIVKVTYDVANHLTTILSTGTVGTINQTATLVINQSTIAGQAGSSTPVFDMAVFTTGSRTIINAPVTGDIGSNGDVSLGWGVKGQGMKGNISVPNGHNVTVPAWSNLYGDGYGPKILDQPRQYILPQFPSFPDLPAASDISLSGRNSYTITSDGKYSNITIASNTTLKIDVGTGTRRIRVLKLDVKQGNIVLLGTGKLELYVDNTLNIKGYLNGDSNTQGNPAQVMLYYGGTDKLTFLGETQLYGTLWIKSADLKLTASGAVKGNIITGGNNVELTGGGSTVVQALYAPNASVSLAGGPDTFKGALVAKTFESDGNAGVTFRPLSTPFPIPIGNLTSGGTSATPNITYYRKGTWE